MKLKPRHPPIPRTFEDHLISSTRPIDIDMCMALHDICVEGDRADADLMLGAQLQPLCVCHWRTGLTELILLRGPPRGERLEWID